MMLEVILIYPTTEGSQEIVIERDKTSFGRGSEADFRFPDNGLSRLNSTVFRSGDNIWIADENSTNGTFVNGAPVSPNGTPLRNGDSVKIGNETILKVRIVEKPAYQPAASSSRNINPVAVSSTSVSSPSRLTSVLPIALTAFALLIIGISAFFIFFNDSGGSKPVIAQNTTGDDPLTDEEDPDETPTPKPTAKPDKVTQTNNNQTSDKTDLTDFSQTQTTPPANLPSGKKYLEMSEAEKKQYVQFRAEKVANLIGNRTGKSITPLAVERIKGFLDGYARRANVSKLSGKCRFGDNLQATYERASKNAPFIIRAFYERGIDAQIGLYLAMIESEHCVCLQSPSKPLGMFQFTYATAKTHFKSTDVIINGATDKNPDDRCKPEPAANAAAEYMKYLQGRYGTDPSSVPLAIGSYNSGEGGLSTNLRTALESNKGLPRDFWTLIANGDKLSKQFQAENFKYVPKFFAAAIVGENPQDFGLNLLPLSSYTNSSYTK